MGGGNLLFIIMFTLPFVAIAGIIMLARNWSTPVEHPEPSGWASAKEKKKAGDPLYGPSSSEKTGTSIPGPEPRPAADSASRADSSRTDSGRTDSGRHDSGRTDAGHHDAAARGESASRAERNGSSPSGSANGDLRARPGVPPQTPAYLDDGDGWLPMDDPANADTGPNPRHHLN